MLKSLERPIERAVGEDDFRKALRLFASGVTVISTEDAHGHPRGMTATAFSSLSLRPPLVLVAIGLGTRCHSSIKAQGQFGISILHGHQAEISKYFGGRRNAVAAPGFTMLDGLPVLTDAMVQLACLLEDQFEGGDHSIFVGRVTATVLQHAEPLIHFDGAYRQLAIKGPGDRH